MRSTSWRAVSCVLVLGLALASCDGPSRGSSTQPSASTGFQLVLSASPNAIRGANANTDEAQGGCATIMVKVFDGRGNLVDGTLVVVSTTLGRFPPSPTRSEAVAVSGFTIRGTFTDVLCAKNERGTAIVTASVEDAVDTTTITIF